VAAHGDVRRAPAARLTRRKFLHFAFGKNQAVKIFGRLIRSHPCAIGYNTNIASLRGARRATKPACGRQAISLHVIEYIYFQAKRIFLLHFCAINVKIKFMKDKTKTWLELAKDDLMFASELLPKKGRAHYAAYFCHQAIEKLLKAIITERTGKVPLPTHNFKILLEQASLLDLPYEKKAFLFGLMPHYIGTKYPEDINKLYKQYTSAFAKNLYAETKEAFRWLEACLK